DPPVLAFAGKQRAAHVERFLQRRRDLRQHRQHAGYVETANHHGNAGLTQRTREIKRVGKLVRLHADQADHAKTVVVAEQVDDLFDLHARVGLVDGADVDFYVRAKNTTLRGVVRQRIKIGERVRWDRRSPPLDDIAVVVVMRRFNQDKLKTPLGSRRCEHGHIPPTPKLFYLLTQLGGWK